MLTISARNDGMGLRCHLPQGVELDWLGKMTDEVFPAEI
jgi:hypothetical protein